MSFRISNRAFWATVVILSTSIASSIGFSKQAEKTEPPTKTILSDSPDVLKGIKSVQILVEEPTKNLVKIGLDKEAIKNTAELSLRRNGIEVSGKSSGAPTLYININSISNAHSIKINLMEPVILDRDPNILVFSGTIWSIGGLGINNGDESYIRKQLEKYLDLFCLDYLKANPKP